MATSLPKPLPNPPTPAANYIGYLVGALTAGPLARNPLRMARLALGLTVLLLAAMALPLPTTMGQRLQRAQARTALAYQVRTGSCRSPRSYNIWRTSFFVIFP